MFGPAEGTAVDFFVLLKYRFKLFGNIPPGIMLIESIIRYSGVNIDVTFLVKLRINQIFADFSKS